MTLDPGVFRQAMSRFASGVTVVTTAQETTLYGLTVSSFTSLSLEPRLVLVCIDHKTRYYQELTQAQHMAINILASDQQELSQHFAGRNKDDWSTIDYAMGQHHVPLLTGALVQLECRITETVPGGDHAIVIGEILAAHVDETKQVPLVYYRGGYRDLVVQE